MVLAVVEAMDALRVVAWAAEEVKEEKLVDVALVEAAAADAEEEEVAEREVLAVMRFVDAVVDVLAVLVVTAQLEVALVVVVAWSVEVADAVAAAVDERVVVKKVAPVVVSIVVGGSVVGAGGRCDNTIGGARVRRKTSTHAPRRPISKYRRGHLSRVYFYYHKASSPVNLCHCPYTTMFFVSAFFCQCVSNSSLCMKSWRTSFALRSSTPSLSMRA